MEAIFQQLNIWYSAAYGTMLGCIRHKGVIPWDDDVDYMMKEEDIEVLTKWINQSEGFTYYWITNVGPKFMKINFKDNAMGMDVFIIYKDTQKWSISND